MHSIHGYHSDPYISSLIPFSAVASEVILSFTQIPVTVQIRSRHGCHSGLYTSSLILPSAVATEVILLLIRISIPVTVSDTLQTRKSFCYSYGSQLQLQSQIHSRHGSHSATHTDLNFRYSPDTLQMWLPFCHSFRVYPQHTDAPYIDISLLPGYNTDTLQTRQSF